MKIKNRKDAAEVLDAVIADADSIDTSADIITSFEQVLAAMDTILSNAYESPEEMAADVAKVRDAVNALVVVADSDVITEDAEAVEETAGKAVAMLEKLVKQYNLVVATKKKMEANRMKLKNLSGDIPSPQIVPDNAKATIITGASYKGKAFKQYGQDAGLKAYTAGRQVAAMLGDEPSKQWLKDHGVQMFTKSQVTDTDSLGGFLVTEELDEAIRYYREDRGAARANMEVVTTSSPTRKFNRNAGGTTVYAMGEGQTYTESDIDFNQVVAHAKKFGAVTKASWEVGEDAYASIAEEIAKDHGYAHGVKEDQVALLGDGTSTYNGFSGVIQSFKTLVTDAGGTFTTDAHKAYAASIKVATGATIASIVDGDITGLAAKVATFPGLQSKYYTYSQFYFEKMVPLARAAGGITSTEFVNGVATNIYNGVPVVFLDELYTPIISAENNAFPLFYGDMAAAGILLDRTGLSFTTDASVGFLSDEVYTKSTARYGVNWWNIGNASATATLRKRGALAALVTKNS